MSAVRRLILTAALCLSAACAGVQDRPAGPVSLSYGGESGETVRYEARIVLRGQVSMQGMPQLVVVKVRMGIEDEIMAVEEDGRRRVCRQYDLTYFEINGMENDLGDLARDGNLEFFRSGTGRVEAVAGTDAPVLTGVLLKPLIVFFPVFPDRAVEAGEEWEVSPGARVSLAGFEPLEQVRCAVLALEGGIEGEYLAAGVERLKVTHSGQVHFSLAEGLVRRARVRGRISGKMRANEMDMAARMEFTSRLDLVTED